MQTEQIVRIPPESILAEGNSRFNLKTQRVNELANNILEVGDVLFPIEVEPLSPPQNGFHYRLTSGFYRHAAVSKLNAEQKAGLQLPAVVRKPADTLERLKHQLIENMQRENQSPMDMAVAIKQLMDAGVPRPEVRRIFSRPTGKKGVQVQPASNAWLNIILRLLELPKAIQEKIHDGRVGLEAAYELGKVPPEKRQAVLERAEAERIAQIEKEEKDEERYLAAEKKLTDAETKQKEALSEVEQAKLDVTKAQAVVDERIKALREVQNMPGFLTMDEKGKKEVTEKLKAADADVKAANKLVKDAQNKVAKLLKTAHTAAEIAEEQKAKLEAARKAKPNKAAKGKGKGQDSPIGPAEVKKAAQKEGLTTGYVPLALADIRSAVKDMVAQKDYPIVASIGVAIKECFDGKETPKQTIHALALITGEVQPTPAAAAPKAKK